MSWLVLYQAALALSLGACAGSFVSTAVLRSLQGEQAWSGPSRCDGCRRPLGYLETAPLVSYALVRGGCRGCGARIDPLHLVGEAAGAVSFALIWAVPLKDTGDIVQRALLTALALLLLALGVHDAKTLRLPDPLTAAVLAVSLALAALHGLPAFAIHLAAAGVVYLLLWGVQWSYARVRDRQGLGLGDVKLLAALAVWLGPAIAWAVVFAALSALSRLSIGGDPKRRLAFGPFIALGALGVGLAPSVPPL